MTNLKNYKLRRNLYSTTAIISIFGINVINNLAIASSAIPTPPAPPPPPTLHFESNATPQQTQIESIASRPSINTGKKNAFTKFPEHKIYIQDGEHYKEKFFKDLSLDEKVKHGSLITEAMKQIEIPGEGKKYIGELTLQQRNAYKDIIKAPVLDVRRAAKKTMVPRSYEIKLSRVVPEESAIRNYTVYLYKTSDDSLEYVARSLGGKLLRVKIDAEELNKDENFTKLFKDSTVSSIIRTLDDGIEALSIKDTEAVHYIAAINKLSVKRPKSKNLSVEDQRFRHSVNKAIEKAADPKNQKLNSKGINEISTKIQERTKAAEAHKTEKELLADISKAIKTLQSKAQEIDIIMNPEQANYIPQAPVIPMNLGSKARQQQDNNMENKSASEVSEEYSNQFKIGLLTPEDKEIARQKAKKQNNKRFEKELRSALLSGHKIRKKLQFISGTKQDEYKKSISIIDKYKRTLNKSELLEFNKTVDYSDEESVNNLAHSISSNKDNKKARILSNRTAKGISNVWIRDESGKIIGRFGDPEFLAREKLTKKLEHSFDAFKKQQKELVDKIAKEESVINVIKNAQGLVKEYLTLDKKIRALPNESNKSKYNEDISKLLHENLGHIVKFINGVRGGVENLNLNSDINLLNSQLNSLYSLCESTIEDKKSKQAEVVSKLQDAERLLKEAKEVNSNIMKRVKELNQAGINEQEIIADIKVNYSPVEEGIVESAKEIIELDLTLNEESSPFTPVSNAGDKSEPSAQHEVGKDNDKQAPSGFSRMGSDVLELADNISKLKEKLNHVEVKEQRVVQIGRVLPINGEEDSMDDDSDDEYSWFKFHKPSPLPRPEGLVFSPYSEQEDAKVHVFGSSQGGSLSNKDLKLKKNDVLEQQNIFSLNEEVSTAPLEGIGLDLHNLGDDSMDDSDIQQQRFLPQTSDQSSGVSSLTIEPLITLVAGADDLSESFLNNQLFAEGRFVEPVVDNVEPLFGNLFKAAERAAKLARDNNEDDGLLFGNIFEEAERVAEEAEIVRNNNEGEGPVVDNPLEVAQEPADNAEVVQNNNEDDGLLFGNLFEEAERVAEEAEIARNNNEDERGEEVNQDTISDRTSNALSNNEREETMSAAEEYAEETQDEKRQAEELLFEQEIAMQQKAQEEAQKEAEEKAERDIEVSKVLSHQFTEDLSLVTQMINNRLLDLNLSDLATAVAAGDEDKKIINSVWTQSAFSLSKQGVYKGSSGYRGISKGLSVGTDISLGDDDTLGIAYSNVESSFKYIGDKLGSKTQARSHIGTLYGKHNSTNALTFKGLLSYIKSAIKVKERKNDGAFNTDKIKGIGYSLDGSIDYKIAAGNDVFIVPNIGLKYSQFKQAGYITHIQSDSLRVKKRVAKVMTGIIGSNLMLHKKLSDSTQIVPQLSLSVEHYIINSLNDAKVTLASTGEFFEAKGNVKQPKLGLNLGGGVALKHKNLELAVSYNCLMKKKYKNHQGALKLKILF